MKKMLKSVFSLILSVTAVICSCVCVYGAEEKPPVEIKAKAAVLMDASTGKVLMKYNEHQRLYPASVTKIMPLLLVTEAIDGGKIALNDMVTVSATAAAKVHSCACSTGS